MKDKPEAVPHIDAHDARYLVSVYDALKRAQGAMDSLLSYLADKYGIDYKTHAISLSGDIYPIEGKPEESK